MKLLLLDDDYIIIEQLKCLMQLDNNWQLITKDDLNYQEIDLVIVDIFNEKYNKILENILEINPRVKTIVASDNLSKKLQKECDYCSKNFNRIRLIKPIKLKMLFDTINDFDSVSTCPCMEVFNDLNKLIPIILKQFKNLFYDEPSQTISTNSDTESKEHAIQTLSLLTLLEKNDIEYTLLNENAIKIHI